jgi:hypothetical protein
MKLRIINITALDPDGFFIQWVLDNAQESGTYTFSIYRSGGSAGPWEPLAENITDTYAFKDTFTAPHPATTYNVVRPNQLNLFRTFFYRVVAKSPSGVIAEFIEELDPRKDNTIEDLKMAQYRRHTRFKFLRTLRLNGTPIVILKRRRWGVRCKCVDKISREIVRSSCRECWGTGFIGGYWSPIKTNARRSVSPNSSAVMPEGMHDSNDVRIWLPDFPSLEKEDVIIFLKDNSRWLVDVVTSTQIRLIEVHQVATIVALDKSHILYRFPVDFTNTLNI